MAWAAPWPFALAGALGPRYGLRCVLFHHLADAETPFTQGLGLTMPPRQFEERIDFLRRHYHCVSLADVRAAATGAPLPKRPLLVTFDDAYASVARVAAPLLASRGVPSVFFVNGAFVGNTRVALDNLLCYALNTKGMDALNAAARAARRDAPASPDLDVFIGDLLPTFARPERDVLRRALLAALGTDEARLAKDADLYVREEELARLPEMGMEIGSHTSSHVWCRALRGDEYRAEIAGNREALARMTGSEVRAFSVPYGSSEDLTPELDAALRRHGHDVVFLVEAVANASRVVRGPIYRVSIDTASDPETFAEVELLPRLRRIRNVLFRRGRPAPAGA